MYLSAQIVRPRGGTYQLGAALSRRPMLRRRLGSITADQAAQTAMPLSSVRGTAGFTQTVYNDLVAAAQNGNFTNFNPSGCQGIQKSGAAIVAAGASVAGGLVLKFSGGNPVLLGVGAALEVGALIFGTMFAHHAAAVAKEQSVICAAVPAASDSLAAIDQAVQNGTITPQQGIDALNGLQSKFGQTVASILKMNSSQCNAACVWIKMLTAIVAKKSADYSDLAAQQASAAAAAQRSVQSLPPALQPVASALLPVGTAVSTAIAPVRTAIAAAGLPSWLLPAAGFFLLWEVL
jgi:hypothetical protein